MRRVASRATTRRSRAGVSSRSTSRLRDRRRRNAPTIRVPVYRAYNNGSARGIDSNHRLTTNRTAIDQVIARGWVDEGIAMCAPR